MPDSDKKKDSPVAAAVDTEKDKKELEPLEDPTPHKKISIAKRIKAHIPGTKEHVEAQRKKMDEEVHGKDSNSGGLDSGKAATGAPKS